MPRLPAPRGGASSFVPRFASPADAADCVGPARDGHSGTRGQGAGGVSACPQRRKLDTILVIRSPVQRVAISLYRGLSANVSFPSMMSNVVGTAPVPLGGTVVG